MPEATIFMAWVISSSRFEIRREEICEHVRLIDLKEDS